MTTNTKNIKVHAQIPQRTGKGLPLREVPMREFYKHMRKFQNPAFIGNGIVVTSNKRPAFIVTSAVPKKAFSLSRLKGLQAKGLPSDLSRRIDEILYGKNS